MIRALPEGILGWAAWAGGFNLHVEEAAAATWFGCLGLLVVNGVKGSCADRRIRDSQSLQQLGHLDSR